METKNIITIKQPFLIFRHQAKQLGEKLQETIRKKGGNAAYLDFSMVTFMSRSFADELLNVISGPALQRKSIEILHQKPNVRAMLNIVKKTKARIQSETFLSSGF